MLDDLRHFNGLLSVKMQGRDQLFPQPCGQNDNSTDEMTDLCLTCTHNTADKANTHHRPFEMRIVQEICYRFEVLGEITEMCTMDCGQEQRMR